MTRALKKWVHENPSPKKSKKKQGKKSTSFTKKRRNKSRK